MKFQLTKPPAPVEYRKISAMIRLNTEEAERLDTLVESWGLTRSEVFRFLVDSAYAQHVADDGVSWPH